MGPISICKVAQELTWACHAVFWCLSSFLWSATSSQSTTLLFIQLNHMTKAFDITTLLNSVSPLFMEVSFVTIVCNQCLTNIWGPWLCNPHQLRDTIACNRCIGYFLLFMPSAFRPKHFMFSLSFSLPLLAMFCSCTSLDHLKVKFCFLSKRKNYYKADNDDGSKHWGSLYALRNMQLDNIYRF